LDATKPRLGLQRLHVQLACKHLGYTSRLRFPLPIVSGLFSREQKRKRIKNETLLATALRRGFEPKLFAAPRKKSFEDHSTPI
jgi:hypothetical protein